MGTYLLLRREIIHDVEEFADLFGCLTLDHVRDGLATNITAYRLSFASPNPNTTIFDSQERLDVEVVGREDDLEEHLLIDSDEFLIPLVNVGGALARIILVLLGVSCGQRLAAMVLAVLENLCKRCDQYTGACTITTRRTFFNTLDDTLGRGIGWSLSPTSGQNMGTRVKA